MIPLDVIRSRFFPFMPDAVFDDWLAGFITDYGWPFAEASETTEGTDFAGVLWGKQIAYWGNLQWLMLRIPMEKVVLHESSEKLTQAIIRHVHGHPGFKVPPENIDERFRRALRFINEFHRLPKPVVAVVQHDATWRIADGHHRLAAAHVAGEQNPVIIESWLGFPQPGITGRPA